MRLLVIISIIILPFFNGIYSNDMCHVQENLRCNQSQISATVRSRAKRFVTKEHLKHNFGDALLQLLPQNSTTQLYMNISFPEAKSWDKFNLRLSEYNTEQNCELLTLKDDDIVMNELYFSCLWNNPEYFESLPYLLEFQADSNSYIAHKNILFSIPDLNFLDDTVPAFDRLMFSYIDFTDIYKIILRIQPLPESYNVIHYKIEVFKEKDNILQMVDVRLIPAENKPVLDFSHFTYSEEGYRYFAISIISDQCPEDACKKTYTPKLYISRMHPTLVVGIVGASFLIPFFLCIFYMWNCRHKYRGEVPKAMEKILILFKPSFEKHNDAVGTLAQTLKHLTCIEVMLDPINLTKTEDMFNEKWCSDNLILATHIIYIPPPITDDGTCDLDYMTCSFLEQEKNLASKKKIMVVHFPYLNYEVPSLLAKYTKFELPQDFVTFINIFQRMIFIDYENDTNYMDLSKKIKIAEDETELVRCNATPKILVTEQSQTSEEAKEIDGLL